jgi:argininosuccinate lyase
MITAKLPSGYQRDLQRLKAPVFRAIDLSIESVDIMSFIVSGLTFRPDRIRLTAGLDAALQAYRLVTEEGIPFREAYRRVAERFSE